MNYVIVIGLFQALLTMMLLQIGKKRRPAGSLILGLLVCVFTHLLLKFFIYVVADYTLLRKEFNTFIGLAYGPVLWMIARQVRDDRYVPGRHWYLLLPAMMAAVAYLSIVLYTVSTGHEPVTMIGWYNSVTLVLILISGVVYPFAAYRTGRQLSAFWATEKKLVQHLSILFMIMAFTGVSGTVFRIIAPPLNLMITIRIISYSLLLLVCVRILRYLLQSQSELKSGSDTVIADSSQQLLAVAGVPHMAPAFPAVIFEPVPQDDAPVLKDTPVKSALAAGQQQKIVAQLDELMQSRKYYTDPDIDLEQLAAIAHISRHHISEALNQYAHKTFYQFLNEYRIQEMLQMLDKCKNNNVRPNILSLAFEVGFNSKSSFNLYFKKSTGLTPSEYLKLGKEEYIA